MKLKLLVVQLVHLSDRYDSHASMETNFQPFLKTQWVNAGKKLPTITTSAEGLKNTLKGRAGSIAQCFWENGQSRCRCFLLFFGDVRCQQMEIVSVRRQGTEILTKDTVCRFDRSLRLAMQMFFNSGHQAKAKNGGFELQFYNSTN